MKARTRDELFIIRAYETATKMGDVHAVLNKYEIGRLAGITEKGVNAISTLLLQANFLKKAGKDEVCLTKHGESLALRLLEEK